MKTFAFALLLTILLTACNSDKDPKPSTSQKSALEYLTDKSSKNWRESESLPISESVSCLPTSIHNQDDVLTFNYDSTFVSDPGSITEHPEDKTCTDALPLSGIFYFIENDSKIVLVVTKVKNTNIPEESQEKDTARVYMINDSKFTIIDGSGEDVDTITLSKIN